MNQSPANEFWSARDLARVLEYSEFRHFLPVIEKAREACLKSNHRVEDHFEQVLEMVGIGSGAQRGSRIGSLPRSNHRFPRCGRR
jgi:DNA-damage-inducible protein D